MVEVLRSNSIAPLKVAALFDDHLPVLSKDQGVFVAELMTKEPPMSLEDFEDLLQDLDGQSEAIRLKCANVVCTGIYRCFPGYLTNCKMPRNFPEEPCNDLLCM